MVAGRAHGAERGVALAGAQRFDRRQTGAGGQASPPRTSPGSRTCRGRAGRRPPAQIASIRRGTTAGCTRSSSARSAGRGSSAEMASPRSARRTPRAPPRAAPGARDGAARQDARGTPDEWRTARSRRWTLPPYGRLGATVSPVKPAMQSLTQRAADPSRRWGGRPRSTVGIRSQRGPSRAVQPESVCPHRPTSPEWISGLRTAGYDTIRTGAVGAQAGARFERLGFEADPEPGAPREPRTSVRSATALHKSAGGVTRLATDDDADGEPSRRGGVRSRLVHRSRRDRRRPLGDTSPPSTSRSIAQATHCVCHFRS